MAAGLVIPQGSLFAGALPSISLPFESNVTGAQFDLVNIQNGQIEIVDAGETIAGYVVDKTAISSSSTDVQVDITPFMMLVMDSDTTGDDLAQDNIGELFDITGGTGAQIVDISETTAGEAATTSSQLILVKQNDGSNWDAGDVRDNLAGDTSIGMLMVVEAQFGQRMGA